MANYTLEIGKYRRLGDRAEKQGHPELAEQARRLAASYEERSDDSKDDDSTRVLEECQRHNDREIRRLQGLRDALMHREAESESTSHADGRGREIAAYDDRITGHEVDNTEIAAKLRELRGV